MSKKNLLLGDIDSQTLNQNRQETIKLYKKKYDLDVTLADFLDPESCDKIIADCYKKAAEIKGEDFPFVSELAKRVRELYLINIGKEQKYFFYDGSQQTGAVRLELPICFEIISINTLKDLEHEFIVASRDQRSGFYVEITQYTYRLTVWGEFR
ncbi:MAG: hypothetical protein ACM3PP_04585 [Candidatus Saccharibacteria bacterium]